MRWFYNLTTGAKLHLGFGTLLLFLAGTAWVAHSQIAQLRESYAMSYGRDFSPALEMADFRADLARDRADLEQMMAAPSEAARTQIATRMKRNESEIDSRLKRIAAMGATDPNLSRALAELKVALESYRQAYADALALAEQGRGSEAPWDGTGADYEKLRELSLTIGLAARDRAAVDIDATGSEGQKSLSIFITIAAVAFLCSALLVLFLNHVIARPLTRISGLAERIAAGDLTVEIPGSGRTDEVGVMQATFGKMVSGLREMTGQIRDGTTVLAAAATEILAATTQLASSAAETASAVAETTTTLEEVKQTSQISSQKARAVSDEARKAAEVAGSGRQSVKQTIEGMEGIQRQMSAIAESILNLSTQSQAIGEIIASVDDLAAQSKLLAVNASIEAAKAGEEGKGFSVVAQEVKSLAEQSKHATAQVRGILGDIQKATGNAVLATEQGGKAVEAGVSQSARAGESINVLTENIAQAAQAATQIAATSQQQFVGVDQVTLAMENIKMASTQTVASTRQAESAAQQLHELGQNLKLIVDRFRV